MVPRASGEALVAGVENPWKGKMLKSPPIGHFSEFSRRAVILTVAVAFDKHDAAPAETTMLNVNGPLCASPNNGNMAVSKANAGAAGNDLFRLNSFDIFSFFRRD